MNIDVLKAQIEPFIASKSESETTRTKYRSYINMYLKFMKKSAYEEMTDESIAEYMQDYTKSKDATTREDTVKEFRDYVQRQVKGEQPSMIDTNENEELTMTHELEPAQSESLPLKSEPESTQETDTDSDMAKPKNDTVLDMPTCEASITQLQALKKRGRKAKGENENRTQISAYLSNEVYAGIKALSVMTQEPISDIVARIMKAFYEDNLEVINKAIISMQHLESLKLQVKYHR